MLVAYLIVINILAFILFAFDKARARAGQWRIRESVLLSLCFIGGSIGGLCGMYFCHHKTRKPLFKFGVPVLLVFNVFVFGYVFQM